MSKRTAMTVCFSVIAVLVVVFTGCGKTSTGPTGAGGYVMQFQLGNTPSAGYTGSSDAGLDSQGYTSNYTNYDGFNLGVYGTGVGYSRMAMKFDMSALIPDTVKVTKAYLTVNVLSITGTNSLVVYELTRGFTPYSATFNTYNGVNSWTTPGGDFSATVKSDTAAAAVGMVTLTLDTAMVQNWISAPSTNYGILIRPSNETTGLNYFAIHTNGAPTAVDRPVLTVYYTLP